MVDKYLFIILAGEETHEGMGRVANALVMAKEIKELGKEVSIIFDGAGTGWVPILEDKNNQMHPLYDELKENIEAVCDFCIGAFQVKGLEEDERKKNDFMGHPSMKKFYEEDYQILTF